LLLVDDEEDNIEMLRRRLSRRGFDIVSATSAGEALEKARAERPDLILMDIKMPHVDGYEATRQLKADEATRAIPVIALTAHAMQEDRERAFAAGADDYESKPLDLPRLLEKIDVLLRPGDPDKVTR
jgi:CheY-like chemotaxis protein